MKKLIIMLIVMIISSYFGVVKSVSAAEPVPTEATITTVQNQTKEKVKAKVIEAGKKYEKQETETMVRTLQDVKIEILEGEFKGEVIDSTYTLTYDFDNKIVGYELTKGNKVLVQINSIDGNINSLVIEDVVRQNYVIWMIIVFFAIILLIGRKQGLKAIIGLIVTVAAIYYIMIRGIYDGKSAVVMAIVTSVVVIVLTFIIISGINKKSITAAIGTVGGVISAGVMSFIFGYLAKLSGGTEEALFLTTEAQTVTFNFKELLFAGIVIAALGACMDVGMSIASSLDEIKQKNPDIEWKELLKSGMNIGGDVIGTMTNTLILAYVGGALTLILLFMASNMSVIDIINKETIVTEAISAIAGSMGVIFTVPITSLVYSLLNKNKTVYKRKPDTIVEGKRSLKL